MYASSLIHIPTHLARGKNSKFPSDKILAMSIAGVDMAAKNENLQSVDSRLFYLFLVLFVW
jgi:hypothetical protein